MAAAIPLRHRQGVAGKIDGDDVPLQFEGEDDGNRPAAAAEIEDPAVRQAPLPAGRQDLLDQELRLRPRDQNRGIDDEGQRPEFPFAKDIGDRFPLLPPLEIAEEDVSRLIRHLRVRRQKQFGSALVQAGPEQQLAVEVTAVDTGKAQFIGGDAEEIDHTHGIMTSWPGRSAANRRNCYWMAFSRSAWSWAIRG